MADTTWSNGSVIDANWMNDVNDAVYSGIGSGGVAPTTPAQVKTNLSLNNVDNTSDVNKPVSTATQTALNLKANLASPTFTGTPEAPTASTGTSSTQIATTAFVQSAISGIQGTFKNLSASASGTAAAITITADELVLENSSNAFFVVRPVSVSLAGTVSGANGLDTGVLASSTWYSIWVIYNPTTLTTAGLMSTSSTAPTLPSGYTFKARVGWIRTDSTGNKYPLSFKQYGRRVQYVAGAGTNVTRAPQITSGASGTYGTTLTSFSVANFVPTTAATIGVSLYQSATNAQVAPNSVATIPGTTGIALSTASTTQISIAWLLLESTNIYYASSGAATDLGCVGWEDNI